MSITVARSWIQITLAWICLLGISVAQQQPSPAKPSSTPKPAPPKISSHVVIIVVNGLGADLLNDQREHLLKLHEQISAGVIARSVEGIYPSLPEPAQATIASGMLPADHGIFADDDTVQLLDAIADPSVKAKKNLYLWESASKAGLEVAAFGYKLAKNASIKFYYANFPDQQHQGKINGNKNWKLDFYKSALEADDERASKACEVIKSAQPNLLLINFTALEFALNQFGIKSKEVTDALKRLDEQLKQISDSTLEAKIQAETTFFLASDSARVSIENEFNPNVFLAKKGWLTVDAAGELLTWKAMAVSLGGAAAIFVKNQADEKAVETLFKEFHQTPDSPIWRVFNRQEISRLATLPQAALMLDAAPGYCFGNAAKGSRFTKAQPKTASGYSPQRVEMRPVFIAFGKGIKPKGLLGIVRMTDIAPTVARLLGIIHSTSRGRVLAEILQP